MNKENKTSLPPSYRIDDEVIIVEPGSEYFNSIGKIVSIATTENQRCYSVRVVQGQPAIWFNADSVFLNKT